MKPNGFVYRTRMAAMLRFWRDQAQAGAALPAALMRDMRTQAQTLKRELDLFLKANDRRLKARLATLVPPKPAGADRVWRPGMWKARVEGAGTTTAGRVALDPELDLYHDCPLGEICARQIVNPDPTAPVPYALVTEVFGFSGSYLSLSVRLPDDLTKGTGARHIVTLDVKVHSDMPITLHGRLNLAQGPEVAQILQTPDPDAGGPSTHMEFDLGRADLTGKPLDTAWIDIFFPSPVLNRIVLSDLVVARRPRAEL